MLSCVPDSVVSELDDFKASCENILESRDVLKFLELSEILEDEAGVLNAQQNVVVPAMALRAYISDFKGGSAVAWILYVLLNAMVLLPYFLISERRLKD